MVAGGMVELVVADGMVELVVADGMVELVVADGSGRGSTALLRYALALRSCATCIPRAS